MSSRLVLFLFLVAVIATCVDAAVGDLNNKRCSDNGRACSGSSECCSGCCSLGSCTSLDRCSAQSQGACAVHYCPPDKECYLQVVQCVTAPCPPIPACRPKNSNDYDNYD